MHGILSCALPLRAQRPVLIPECRVAHASCPANARIPVRSASTVCLCSSFSVTFYDEWSAGTRAARARVAVHEFAHVWDHGVGSFESESIGEYVGLEARVNSSALASAQEHWAETVESWVYDPRGVLGPRHRQFVGLAVQGQAPAPSNYVDPYQGWWTQ